VFFSYPKTASFLPPTDRIRDAVKAAAPAGAEVGATGNYELQTSDADSSSDGSPSVLIEVILGGVGALLVLIFVFASFLALLPLIVAVFSILAAFLFLLPLTYIGHISFIVQFLIALVGLGVAIDYSLLLVTRWREERDHGRDNHDAVVVAMETAGHAVLFSGMTVAIGLVALVILPVPFMQSMGVGGALIPLTSVMATLSLTPVVLSSIGPKVDWPKIRHENMASRGWSRWAALVVKRRWLSAIVALAALGALLGVLSDVKIGQSSSDSLAKSGPAYEALQTLKKGGVPTGVLTPIEVLTQADKSHDIADQLGKVPGVTGAVVADSIAANGENVLLVLPKDETVNGKSVDVVRDVISESKKVPGVIGIAGIGPGQIDFLEAVYGNFPLMLCLLALFTYVLLVRAFRSLLLPLKAVLLNLISLGATIGMMVLFWQDGIGSDALFGIKATGAVTFWIPLMVFAFLFGLSMDYEVFILARIREEYDGARSTDAAVVEGIGRTGRLVTSAALILFLSFAALASGPGTDTKVMATGLGFGVLLDATIVRSLLVPSLVSLFGSWNWYLPAWAAKILRVEPSYPHPEPSRKELATSTVA